MLERANFTNEQRKRCPKIIMHEANDTLMSHEIRLLGLTVFIQRAYLFEIFESTRQISNRDIVHNGVLHS